MKLYFTPTRELVTRKVHELFPQEQWATAFEIIGFDDPAPDAADQARVQLATLKLSEGNLDKLAEYAKIAKTDFRDVLAEAEYPNRMQYSASSRLNEVTWRDIVERDRQQYLEWLNGPEGQDPKA